MKLSTDGTLIEYEYVDDTSGMPSAEEPIDDRAGAMRATASV